MNDAGDVKCADEAVMNDDYLRSILARSLHGKDLDLFNQLSENMGVKVRISINLRITYSKTTLLTYIIHQKSRCIKQRMLTLPFLSHFL